MMTPAERESALSSMRAASDAFYAAATRIGSHPFIEFTGLINEYIKACEEAHKAGIDFTECNRHSGVALPLAPHMSMYINEKLECIFSGSKILEGKTMEYSP